MPGSDRRSDYSEELRASKNKYDTSEISNEEAERMGLSYCHAMPKAENIILESGDFALYRPRAWHLGNYVPYLKRATLHDSVWNPQAREWYRTLGER